MRNKNKDRFDFKNGQPKERKAFPIEIMQIDGEAGIVEAIVAVMGNIDDGNDIIHPGAFVKSITERSGSIPMLDNHNHFEGKDVIGNPLEIREIGRDALPPTLLAKFPSATGGLFTRTQFFIDEPSDNSAMIFRRIKAGAINQYSIGFDALDTDNSVEVNSDGAERDVRNIRTIRLWEFSPVIFAMNTATTTVGVKAVDVDESDEGKAAEDAPNLQAAPEGSAQICHLCEHFNAVTEARGYCDQFEFLTGNDDLCDAFAVKGTEQEYEDTIAKIQHETQGVIEWAQLLKERLVLIGDEQDTEQPITLAGSSSTTPTDKRESMRVKAQQLQAQLKSMED